MNLQKYEFNQITIPSGILLYIYLFLKEVISLWKRMIFMN